MQKKYLGQKIIYSLCQYAFKKEKKTQTKQQNKDQLKQPKQTTNKTREQYTS